MQGMLVNKPLKLYLLIGILLLSHSVSAAPVPRLIIQFELEPDALQSAEYRQHIEHILQSRFSILPQSTAQRWLITLPTAITTPELESLIAQITQLSGVRYVERDVMFNWSQ